MSLPFNLQRLPPEAISVLRFLGQRNAAASTQDFEDGLDIGPRAVGKAIRRLVNFSLIQMDVHGTYQLTGDGRRAYQQLADNESASAEQPTEHEAPKIMRRLTVVLPQMLINGQTSALYIGVNPPAANTPTHAQSATLELRLSAVGGKFSAANVALEVPPDRAADPIKVMLAAAASRPVRVRIDAFQSFDIDRIEPIGGMYFDIPVVTRPVSEEATRRAVGVDLALA